MDIEERIFDKLDKIETRIGDLCLRLSALESEYNSHMEAANKKHDKKLRQRDFTIVVIAVVIAGIEASRSLGLI